MFHPRRRRNTEHAAGFPSVQPSIPQSSLQANSSSLPGSTTTASLSSSPHLPLSPSPLPTQAPVDQSRPLGSSLTRSGAPGTPLQSPTSTPAVIHQQTPKQPSQTSSGVVWEGVKTTLRLVRDATDVFPPLKSTSAGLLAIIDLFEVGLSSHVWVLAS